MEQDHSSLSIDTTSAIEHTVTVIETPTTAVTTQVIEESMSSASPSSSGRSTPFSTMSDASTLSTSSSSSTVPSSPTSSTSSSKMLHRTSSIQNLRDKSASFFNRRDIVVSDTRYFGGRNTNNHDYTNATISATFPRVRADPNSRVRFQALLAKWKSRDVPAAADTRPASGIEAIASN